MLLRLSTLCQPRLQTGRGFSCLNSEDVIEVVWVTGEGLAACQTLKQDLSQQKRAQDHGDQEERSQALSNKHFDTSVWLVHEWLDVDARRVWVPQSGTRALLTDAKSVNVRDSLSHRQFLLKLSSENSLLSFIILKMFNSVLKVVYLAAAMSHQSLLPPSLFTSLLILHKI